MDTDRLIHALSSELRPVVPLAPPWRRALAWAAGAAAYVALMVVVMAPREDLPTRMRDLWFVLEQAAALAAVLLAAVAAFATSLPGRSRLPAWLAVGAAAAWLGLVLLNAARDAQQATGGEALFYTDWGCVAAVLTGTSVPAVMMLVMLRRGAAVSPTLTAALGGLAAAGLGNLGGCLSHPDASNVIVLVWHVGTVIVVAAFAGVLGPRFLHWPVTAVQP
jgi:hypothetical protein